MSVKCNCGEILPLTTAGPAHVCKAGASEEARLDPEIERLLGKIIQFASEHGTPSTKKVSIRECATCRETAAALRQRIRTLIEEAREQTIVRKIDLPILDDSYDG